MKGGGGVIVGRCSNCSHPKCSITSLKALSVSLATLPVGQLTMRWNERTEGPQSKGQPLEPASALRHATDRKEGHDRKMLRVIGAMRLHSQPPLPAFTPNHRFPLSFTVL
jgi:hypothetical protein